MIQVPKGADEDWFNKHLRDIYRSQNLQVLHIREADLPGPSDHVVWAGSEILGWVELKVFGKPLEVSQKEFLRRQDAEAGNAFMFNLNRDGVIRAMRGTDYTWNGLELVEDILDPYAIQWKKWFWDHRRSDRRYR